MAKELRLYHILIAVENLADSKKEYEGYGFTVVYGGTEKDTYSTFIFLKDSTLIELVGKDRSPRLFAFLNKLRITRLFSLMKDRITGFRKIKARVFNYCLYSNNLNSTHYCLKQNGIKAVPLKIFSRFREDGACPFAQADTKTNPKRANYQPTR